MPVDIRIYTKTILLVACLLTLRCSNQDLAQNANSALSEAAFVETSEFQSSTLRITVDALGQSSYGTGVIVGESEHHYIGITTYHGTVGSKCPSHSCKIYAIDPEGAWDIYPMLAYAAPGQKTLSVIEDGIDVFFFTFAKKTGKSYLKPMRFYSGDIKPGTVVGSVGYPSNVLNKMGKEYESQIITRGLSVRGKTKGGFARITAITRGGNSGGPVVGFDEDNQPILIGITRGGTFNSKREDELNTRLQVGDATKAQQSFRVHHYTSITLISSLAKKFPYKLWSSKHRVNVHPARTLDLSPYLTAEIFAVLSSANLSDDNAEKFVISAQLKQPFAHQPAQNLLFNGIPVTAEHGYFSGPQPNQVNFEVHVDNWKPYLLFQLKGNDPVHENAATMCDIDFDALSRIGNTMKTNKTKMQCKSL